VVSGEREQNWYPIGKVGWFTQHIREGIEVTAEQLRLLQPALAQPYRLDDATVARIIRVHQDQAGDLTLFKNQAGRWNGMPGLTAAQRAAVGEYEAAIGELRRLNAEVLAAAEQLKPVTIEALLARSDLEVGIEALLRGWSGTGLSSNGAGQWRVAQERPVLKAPHCPFQAYLVCPRSRDPGRRARGRRRAGQRAWGGQCWRPWHGIVPEFSSLPG
jgi:hypothetical protein